MKDRVHHPRISLPVVRRRLAGELLDLLAGWSDILLTRGRALSWNYSFPNPRAYRTAAYRLQKAGLIAMRRAGGKTPLLMLTDKGRQAAAESVRPVAWPRKWSGRWYVLMYDVPEAERRYRDVLRAFLKRLRMGSLQRSVWVTPRDIRPEYDDLLEAAAVDDYAVLFESRSVLAHDDRQVVRQAWDMERLAARQKAYIQTGTERLARLSSNKLATAELIQMAREDLLAYHDAMDADPLLPRPLWPDGYRGEQVQRLHQRWTQAVAWRL
jgi:phenylacetic acid degradation operon negative regulatory protein